MRWNADRAFEYYIASRICMNKAPDYDKYTADQKIQLISNSLKIVNYFKNKLKQGVVGLVGPERYIVGWMLYVIVGGCNLLNQS